MPLYHSVAWPLYPLLDLWKKARTDLLNKYQTIAAAIGTPTRALGSVPLKPLIALATRLTVMRMTARTVTPSRAAPQSNGRDQAAGGNC